MRKVAIVCVNDRVTEHVGEAFSKNDSLVYINLTSIESTAILADASLSLIILHLNSFKIESATLVEQVRSISKKAVIFVLSDIPTFEEATLVIEKGSKGYSNSRMPTESMIFAIEAVERGDIWMPPEYIFELIKNVKHNDDHHDELAEKLSKKEYDVAKLVALGYSNNAIAEQLEITERTVKSHLSAAFEKLNIKDRLSLALLVKNI